VAHIFVLYRLKPDVTRDDFEAWLKANNSMALRSIRRLETFTVFRVEKRVMTQEPSSVDYIDLFDIPDIAGFINEDLVGSVSRKNMEEFSGFADRPEYLLATAVTGNKLGRG
jgi:hypothetical protein